MNVLVLGGTGAIGSAVVTELLARHHTVSILCRSASSEIRAQELGAVPIPGSIDDPAPWVDRLAEPARTDAVIHLATGFGSDAGNADRKLLDAIFERAATRPAHAKLRLLYTGGIWLFGSCTEAPGPDTPFRPPNVWQWAATGCTRVLAEPSVTGMVIHPANVTDDETGVPPILLTDAQTHCVVRIPLPPDATWPLVQRSALARLYADTLEHGGAGTVCIGVSEEAVRLDELARRTARATGIPGDPIYVAASTWQEEYGDWACGCGLSQVAQIRRYFSNEGTE